MRRNLRRAYRRHKDERTNNHLRPSHSSRVPLVQRKERVRHAIENSNPYGLIQAEIKFNAQQQAQKSGEYGNEIDCQAIEEQERIKLELRGFTEREQNIILLKRLIPDIKRKELSELLQESERRIKSDLRIIQYYEDRSPDTKTRKRRTQ